MHKGRKWYYYFVWDKEGNRQTRGVIDDLKIIKGMRQKDVQELGKKIEKVGSIEETTATTIFR